MNADPNSRKARSDAKLKTLPPERQAAIFEQLNKPTNQDGGYANTLKWLREDGFKTSHGALVEFFSWYRLQQRLATNARTVDQVIEDLKREDPQLSDEQLERAGQRFFSALAIDQEDSLTWKRIQDAKLKLGALELGRQKFLVDSNIYFEGLLNKAKELLADNSLTQADRIAALRKAAFADVEALEKSGKLVIPK